MKSILGTDNLAWDTEQQEGAYKGHQVFDHMKPNIVSNEMRGGRNDEYKPRYANQGNTEIRARSNEMKRNINNDYVNDWSTESGNYKGRSGRVNDENQLARSNSGRHSSGYGNPASDYDRDYAPPARMTSGRAPSMQSMGGSLAQFQSEAANYSQPVTQARSARNNSGNSSNGFASAFVQPDRDNCFRNGGAPAQGYQYKNNIYGQEEAPRRGQGLGYNPHATTNAAPYASDDHYSSGGQYASQSQYRAAYQEPPSRAYDEYAQAQAQAYGQRAPDPYAVPGLAPEGAGNREGRSTRPW